MKHSTTDVLDAIDQALDEADHAYTRALGLYGDAMESVRDLLDGAAGFDTLDHGPNYLDYRGPEHRTGEQELGQLHDAHCCRETARLDLPLIGGTAYLWPDEDPAATADREIWVRYHYGQRGFSRHEAVFAGLPEDAVWNAPCKWEES